MKWTRKSTQQDHENPMANDFGGNMLLWQVLVSTQSRQQSSHWPVPCRGHMPPVACCCAPPPPLPTGVHGASTMVGQPGQLGTGALTGGVATGGHHGGSAAVCHSCGGVVAPQKPIETIFGFISSPRGGPLLDSCRTGSRLK